MRSNRGVAILPKSKQRMLVTADVGNILQDLNGNTFWKNSTNKINTSKNIKGGTATRNRKNNQMTQEQIDKLFESKQKNKIKTQILCDEVQHARNHKKTTQIKFLYMEDSYDKLIAGLKSNNPAIFSNDATDKENNDTRQDLTQQFKQKFLVGKIIGEGAYASVRVAIYKTINKKVAIKVYQKNKIKESQRKKSVRRQIQILQQLDHFNIVKIYDVVQTNNHLNIVMEYLDGISLNSFLKNQTNHRISQNKCRKIMKGLASALKYMHSMYIAHRDLKLENVIIDDNLNPKLIDFGFSTCLGKEKKVKIFCGTPSYMAPQIVQKKQYTGQKADIWALGVLFFVCVTGIFPFKGSTDQELYNKINKAEYSRSELAFSKEITDLIGRMLKTNPDQRISASQILQHSWLKNQHSHLNTQASQSKNKRSVKQSVENQNKRRITTISSHKSKQSWTNKQIIRLTETYKQNLKLQLRLAKQSPIVSYNNTCTNRKKQKDNGSRTFVKRDKSGKSRLDNSELLSTKGNKVKKDKKKNETRILELFKNELKVKDDKQKSRSKKKYY